MVQKKQHIVFFFFSFFTAYPFWSRVFFLLFRNKTDTAGNKSDKSTRRLVGGDHDSFRGFVFCLELKALHIYKPSNFQSRDVKNHSSSSILIFANAFPLTILFFFFTF